MATCASVVKPGRCAIPHEPISSVMRAVLYPTLLLTQVHRTLLPSSLLPPQTMSQSRQLALQAITASESHMTAKCLLTTVYNIPYISMRFRKDGMTPGCLVASSLLVVTH